MLWYVKGGAAVTRDKYEGIVTATGLVFDRATETRWGGVVGVGIEFSFAPNWSIAIEYDHLFMGTATSTFTRCCRPPACSPAATAFARTSTWSPARLNYRFGGPVVAKY